MNWENLLKKQKKKFKKKTENQCQYTACEQNTTSEKRKFVSNKKKLGLERTINGLEKPFRKNPIPEIEKNSINQSEIQ